MTPTRAALTQAQHAEHRRQQAKALLERMRVSLAQRDNQEDRRFYAGMVYALLALDVLEEGDVA